ncbi:MAG TPA: formyltetrahydrofolate deformylase [Acidimicrobiales bacterium]|jgi:formyltetrahydrofolate deformylase|nr:formyltetrahydrofolate deformylase [Acidimicrobiales bacterium]
MRRFILTVTCPDRVGIVAAVTGLIAGRGGSVLQAAQHGDLDSGRFFLRIEVVADSLPAGFGPDELAAAFGPVADEFSMAWRMSGTDVAKRVALFASKEDHCIADLLYRWRAGELECDIPCVISNHEDLRALVEWHGIAFRYVPVGTTPAAKAAAFDDMEQILAEEQADVVVLARYMQILPASFCAGREGRIINIHHSFLPSFAGARPYHQAFARGVKLIGATCHYVTAELDEGPIIEQDTRRIDHGDTVEELQRVGRDVERTVLARGLRWHLQDRILLNGHKTVVFP